MKNKRNITVLVILLISLCIWRMWPHEWDEIVPVGDAEIHTITVKVSEFGIRDNSPYIDTYKLEISSPEASHYHTVLDMIDSTKFRTDFRNLLPWDTTTVSSDDITHTAIVQLTWGDSENDTCFLSLQDKHLISVDIADTNEFLIYHPTNRTILPKLVTYVKENGVLQ